MKAMSRGMQLCAREQLHYSYNHRVHVCISLNMLKDYSKAERREPDTRPFLSPLLHKMLEPALLILAIKIIPCHRHSKVSSARGGKKNSNPCPYPFTVKIPKSLAYHMHGQMHAFWAMNELERTDVLKGVYTFRCTCTRADIPRQ